MDKTTLIQRIVGRLREDFDLQVRAAALARDEATNEESRAENKYDTRGQEAAYLAEGQARLAAEIEQSINLYHALPADPFPPDAPAALGALIETVSARGVRSWFFLGPRSGGLELEIEGQHVLVVTPASPLGRQLLGRRVGDQLTLPGKPSAPATVVAVQ
ncbi:GreA/GreB family elongation factor [Horticoccus luteus]|uniref:GreA/GreB family elongation factor n=1 Tax=Horticoccus luteus TaxID=2862869 RepID=A0A8F9XMT4_9BACT|nr:GreA/GreB family elongation factor [Horticoccus luteus]QYM80621.1 GreA/GreB family elongation factor [Horticoccus luteus]